MEETLERMERQLLNKEINFSSIYKAAFKNSGFTVMCSGIISLCIIIFYALFSLIYNSINFEFTLSTFEILIALATIGLITGLITPFVYSFFACYQVMKTPKGDEVTMKNFFKTYMIGISKPFRTALSNFKTVIITFLIYILLGFVAMIIVLGVARFTTGELHEFIIEFNNIDFYADTAIDEVSNLLTKYQETLNTVSLYVEFFSLIFAGYFYIHSTAKNTSKYFYAMMSDPKNPNSVNVIMFIYKRGIKGHRIEYHKYFYKILWPMTLLYFVTFSVTYFLAAFLLSLDLVIVALTAFIIPLVLLTLFLPVVFELNDNLFPIFQKYYFKSASKIMRSQFDEYKASNSNEKSEEELKEIENSLNSLDEYIKEANESEEEEKEEDKEN
ncbi:MAG: hypothetical protein IJ186_05240 [Bacilli bacterium]|nr:hypothetical protein [Bacilli bacterium]